MTTKYFLTRMRNGRLRQLTISGCSVAAAALFMAYLSPSEIGSFSFYSITALLVVNSVLALLQFQQVIRPVEKLLTHLNDIAMRLEYDDLERMVRMTPITNDVFGYLAAGIDDVVGTMVEKLQNLRDSSNTCSEIMAAMPIALLIMTRDGKVAKIVNANGMGESLKGFRLGEKPLESYWGEANAAKFGELIAKASGNRNTIWGRIKVDHDNWRQSELYTLSIRQINEMSMLLTILNVTNLVRETFANEKDQQNRRRDGSDNTPQKQAALRLMAASLAHDAKNVFAALNNIVTLNRTSTDPAVREQIPIAEDAIRRGTNLMSELTDIAGETSYHLKCTPAIEGIKASLENPTVQALFPKNVNFFPWFSDKPMPEIDLDMDQAWKVALNLFKNAIEAMGETGGSIWVKVEPFAMNEEISRTFRHSGRLQLGSGVLVTVTDDGPGIAQEVLERIFDPYFSNKGLGRGLGLTSVMTIVDAHGGAMNVKSSLGKGTSFYIYIPASRNSSAELKMIKSVAPNGEILLVDDDPTILHTTGLVLRTLKIAAHPAANEADALTKLRSLRSRLMAVIVDANLNCASSAGLVRTIREEFPDMPIIVSSGAPEETIRRQFADAEFDRFLVKPYSVGDLSGAIAEVTDKA